MLLGFWKNKLFADLVALVFPLALIFLIPGLIYCFQKELYELAIYNTLAFSLLCFIAFYPKLSIKIRKTLFMICIYFVFFFLFFYIGLLGPALLYLYCAAVFGVLIFVIKQHYLWSWINTLICILICVLIYFETPASVIMGTDLIEWIVISSNLVVLSFITTTLAPIPFQGLEESLIKQVKLKEELDKEKEVMKKTLFLLEEKNNQLEQFNNLASHDLQEPLRNIHTYIELLDNRYSDQLDGRAKKYINFTLNGAKQINNLVRQMLDYSKVGLEDIAVEEVDINELVYEVVELLKINEQLETVEIEYTNLPTIRASRIGLFLVFQNLIQNALKFRKKEGRLKIEIKYEEQKNFHTFLVSDNGIGIADEYKKFIFELLKRLHSQHEIPGSGIGLASCKKIIERHQGEIWVESQLDIGSTFIFKIFKGLS